MKILNISDTHGFFPDLKTNNIDVIVHSGDWLPNKPSSFIGSEEKYQEGWLKSKVLDIKDWLKNKPLIFIQGNHDFINVDLQEHILRAAGIDASQIDNKLHKFHGYHFYGFPSVPWINGSFNHEKTSDELLAEVDEIVKKINRSEIDVLVAHAPPGGILDKARNGVHYGNSHLTNAIMYKMTMFPKAICCGHLHEQGGKTLHIGDMIISNAATKQNIIEI